MGPFSISYIDDAANPLNTPVYLGVLFTIAIFGPAAGKCDRAKLIQFIVSD